MIEVRVPKAKDQRTISGYFSDIERMAQSVAHLEQRKYPGIYWTINPVNPALLARAENKTKPFASETTSDRDIVKLAWLPVDLDPVRPAGISSSEEERGAALAVAERMIQELGEQGWPAPVFADSGNGYHLLWRIDLTNDPLNEDMLKRVLQALGARFDTEQVKVDRTTFNPSRIFKIYGTTARKGDARADRPHRLSRLLKVPGEILTLSHDALRQMAASAPVNKQGSRPESPGNVQRQFRIEDFLSKHGLAHWSPADWDGGRKFILEHCPFNPAHEAPDSMVFEQASGALGFKCLHNSCSDYTWKDLREKFEGPKRPYIVAPVQLGSAAPQLAEIPAPVLVTKPGSGGGRNLPRIQTTDRQLRDMSEDAIQSLIATNDPPFLFKQGSRLVTIAYESSRAVIRNISEPHMRGFCTRSADYFKVAPSGKPLASFPPVEVVKDILDFPRECFAQLEGIVQSPIVRPDGSLHTAPGFDPVTGLYYDRGPLVMPELDPTPGRDHIDAARDLIDQMLGEFPFKDQPSKANVIAAAATSIFRDAFAGPSPFFLLAAPAAGTGKTLMADCICLVATGQPAEMFSSARDEDEQRKQITTILMSGTGIAVIDNICGKLDSAELCKLFTETRHCDRMFRTHEKVVLPVRTVFIGTGNNIQLGGDLPRRCVWVRLDAQMARPDQRGGFRHPDLKAWVLAHRGELLAAFLTLGRAWYVAGCPKPKITPMGSFEAWSTTIGGILEYAGIDGFLGNAVELYAESDADAQQWEAFLHTLDDVFCGERFTVAQLANRLYNEATAPTSVLLKDYLPDYLAAALDRQGFFRQRAGKAFAARADRRFGESQVYLCRAGVEHKAQCWRIEMPGAGGNN